DGKAAEVQLRRAPDGYALHLRTPAPRPQAPEQLAAWQVFAEAVEQPFLPARIAIALCDEDFDRVVTRVPLRSPRARLTVGKSTIYYLDGATQAEALRLGDTLAEMGMLRDDTPLEFELRRDGEALAVAFVVKDRLWDDPQTIADFADVGRTLGKRSF